jgi:probable F420-dependent oxidoreductase
MVALSGKLTAGAHPYLVTPEHTAGARAILGAGPLLAPEQGVMLETDRDKAHALAIAALEHYRRLPNYVNNWLRLGFTQDEIDTAAPRLLDGLFGWGTAQDVATRARAHLDAGADHVCLQLITGGNMDIPLALAGWRKLAGVLL